MFEHNRTSCPPYRCRHIRVWSFRAAAKPLHTLSPPPTFLVTPLPTHHGKLKIFLFLPPVPLYHSQKSLCSLSSLFSVPRILFPMRFPANNQSPHEVTFRPILDLNTLWAPPSLTLAKKPLGNAKKWSSCCHFHAFSHLFLFSFEDPFSFTPLLI